MFQTPREHVPIKHITGELTRRDCRSAQPLLGADESREIVVDRITRIDEVLGVWVKDVFLGIDLEQAGREGMEQLGGLFETFGEPCELRPLKLEEDEEVAANEVAVRKATTQAALLPTGLATAPAPVPVAPVASPEIEAPLADGLMDADPDLLPAPILAQPVPLVVEVERDGKTWLVKSEGRNIALTLESLRRLRALPGLNEMRLRAVLPAPAAQKKRFFSKG